MIPEQDEIQIEIKVAYLDRINKMAYISLQL